MSFSIRTVDNTGLPNLVAHRIVPVRFARAVTGFADEDAPDLDDHGFTPADDFGPKRGPAVGIKRGHRSAGAVQPGPTVRVKVVRDRIEASAQIFPKMADPTVAELVCPAAGSALSAEDIPAAGTTPAREGDCVYFRATSTTNSTQETVLELHYGSVDGPLLAEMNVRVHPVLGITVKLHKVAIKGAAAPGTSLASLRRLFNKVNAIYCQAGIEFSLDSAILPEAVNVYAIGAVRHTFAQAGLISSYVEAKLVLTVNPVRDALNAYYFPNYAGNPANIAGTYGWALSRSGASAVTDSTGTRVGQPGITFRDPDGAGNLNVMAWTVAHELGHALTMEHYANGQRETTVRHDIWAHRNLMHNFINIAAATMPAGNIYPSSNARIQVGYGAYAGATRPGSALMIKKRTGRIFQSDQTNLLRAGALAGSYKPF